MNFEIISSRFWSFYSKCLELAFYTFLKKFFFFRRQCYLKAWMFLLQAGLCMKPSLMSPNQRSSPNYRKVSILKRKLLSNEKLEKKNLSYNYNIVYRNALNEWLLEKPRYFTRIEKKKKKRKTHARKDGVKNRDKSRSLESANVTSTWKHTGREKLTFYLLNFIVVISAAQPLKTSFSFSFFFKGIWAW